MASLNTLRTRFGVVLSVVIGLALLAFVLSLKTEMGFSGNDPKVGVIDGNKIKYSDYIEEYDRVKARHAGSESDPQQADMLADAAWQELFSKNVLVPGFEKMGIVVGEQGVWPCWAASSPRPSTHRSSPTPAPARTTWRP